tara:strand:- start:177 stop:368 length:192 start_codon:yes stop_codon:yes gene_type:complete
MIESQRLLTHLNNKLDKLSDLNADNYSAQIRLGIALNAVKYDLAMQYRDTYKQVKELKLKLRK